MNGNTNSGIYSVLASPLRIGDRISGTIVIVDDRPEKNFTTHDLSILEQLIPQSEVAIGYARLSAQLQERLTAQHLVEGQLVRSARLAAVGEMAAGVAHELNNPINNISLTAEAMRQFVEVWCAHRHRHKSNRRCKECEARRRDLREAVVDHSRVRALAGNPMMLTILLLLSDAGVTLPQRRWELYEKIAEAFLFAWQEKKRKAIASSPDHGLQLDDRTTAFAELDSGLRAIVPGDVEQRGEGATDRHGGGERGDGAHAHPKNVSPRPGRPVSSGRCPARKTTLSEQGLHRKCMTMSEKLFPKQYTTVKQGSFRFRTGSLKCRKRPLPLSPQERLISR